MAIRRSSDWSNRDVTPIFLGWRSSRTRTLKSSAVLPARYKSPAVIAEWYANEQEKCDSLTTVVTAARVDELVMVSNSGKVYNFDKPASITHDFDSVMKRIYGDEWYYDAAYESATDRPIVFCGNDVQTALRLLCYASTADKKPWPASLWTRPAVCDIYHALVPDADQPYVDPKTLLEAIGATDGLLTDIPATLDMTPLQQAAFQYALYRRTDFFYSN